MSDTDEIRAALSEALRLPGEVRARPAAASSIRSRARSRRRTAVVSFAVAVPACLGLVALLVGTNDSSPRSVAPPATKVTASPHASTPATEISIAPGPRTLAAAIEFRPVLQEYLTCPAQVQTVPEALGSRCYRLGPAAMVVRRVRDLGTSLVSTGTGTASDQTALLLTMTAHDAALFSSLTAASLNKQVALVVNGKVRSAPTINGHITEGRLQLAVEGSPARFQALVTELTG